jgi:hypothetical protein
MEEIRKTMKNLGQSSSLWAEIQTWKIQNMVHYTVISGYMIILVLEAQAEPKILECHIQDSRRHFVF